MNGAAAGRVINGRECIPAHLRPLMIVLALHSSNGGDVHMFVSELASITGRSARQISRDLSELERLALIRTDKRAAGHRPTCWTIAALEDIDDADFAHEPTLLGLAFRGRKVIDAGDSLK